MSNGLKHHSSEHSATNGLVQLNQCNDKILTAQVCFVDGDYKPLHMKKTRLRVFDVDMGQNPERKGPEAVQFHCPGGSFEVYGPNPPYVSWTAGKPSVQEEVGYHGLTKHTYTCPDDEIVTVWAHLDGTLNDNPESAVPAELTAEQQKRTLLIEFHDTECANLTFASMPPFYRQVEGNGGGGWDISQNAANGGNPLNDTRRLTYESFDGLEDGPCPFDGGGRNNFIAGYFDENDMLDCDQLPPPKPPPRPTDCKNGSRTNAVKTNAKGVGAWGGTCTCPDGSEYQVGTTLTNYSTPQPPALTRTLGTTPACLFQRLLLLLTPRLTLTLLCPCLLPGGRPGYRQQLHRRAASGAARLLRREAGQDQPLRGRLVGPEGRLPRV